MSKRVRRNPGATLRDFSDMAAKGESPDLTWSIENLPDGDMQRALENAWDDEGDPGALIQAYALTGDRARTMRAVVHIARAVCRLFPPKVRKKALYAVDMAEWWGRGGSGRWAFDWDSEVNLYDGYMPDVEPPENRARSTIAILVEAVRAGDRSLPEFASWLRRMLYDAADAYAYASVKVPPFRPDEDSRELRSYLAGQRNAAAVRAMRSMTAYLRKTLPTPRWKDMTRVAPPRQNPTRARPNPTPRRPRST